MSTHETGKTPAVHLIGNAHLDPVWLWRWQEGCAEAIGTCWAAVDRLEDSEGFVFTKGEAHIYAWIEELDPELFARIAAYIREGRWIVVNGWWIQPDCNVPSGESVIRQALYGKRYFADRFGVDVSTGYNVDSFGHPGTFPMLLRHTGSTSYTFMRPGPHEMKLPGELFTWQSPDGSEVTAFRIQGAYNTSKREMPLPEKIDLHLKKAAESGHPFMCFYGVGNHGGAPTIENIREINARLASGDDVAFSDPDRFFASVSGADLPRVETELQFHAIGCYAAASSLKQLNRKAESLLEQAEAAAVLASRELAIAYPRERFETLWRKLLFNQFHDTLGGTSLESACIDSERELAMVISGAEEELNAGIRHLGRGIAPPVDPTNSTFLVVNTNGQALHCLVEAEPWVDKDNVSKRVLLDEKGNTIPFQYTDPHGKTTGLQRICFALDIPAYGYRTLRFRVDKGGKSAPPVGFGTSTGDLQFETAAYRMRIDERSGAIAELFDKGRGINLFMAPGHRALIVDDPTDTWSHGIDQFGFAGEDLELLSVGLIEKGDVRTVIKLEAGRGATRMTTQIVLPEDVGLPVELRVHLDWREQRRLLRLSYPFGIERFEYEVAAGWDSRPANGREVPGQRWVRAVGDDRAVAVVNDAKYSYAAQDGTLYVTAMRTPVFAHHDPIELVEGAHYRFMDQGEHSFTIQLLAAAELGRKRTHALAEALNKPAVTTPHISRGGTRAHAGQWLDVDAPTSAIGCLKCAEDGNGLILRAVELDGMRDRLRAGGRTVPVPPREIVSARLTADDMVLNTGLEQVHVAAGGAGDEK